MALSWKLTAGSKESPHKGGGGPYPFESCLVRIGQTPDVFDAMHFVYGWPHGISMVFWSVCFRVRPGSPFQSSIALTKLIPWAALFCVGAPLLQLENANLFKYNYGNVNKCYMPMQRVQ